MFHFVLAYFLNICYTVFDNFSSAKKTSVFLLYLTLTQTLSLKVTLCLVNLMLLRSISEIFCIPFAYHFRNLLSVSGVMSVKKKVGCLSHEEDARGYKSIHSQHVMKDALKGCNYQVSTHYSALKLLLR